MMNPHYNIFTRPTMPHQPIISDLTARQGRIFGTNLQNLAKAGGASPTAILSSIDEALGYAQEIIKDKNLNLIRKFSDFLKEHNNNLVKYASAEFTQALTNFGRLVNNSYNLGQKAKSTGSQIFSSIDNAGMWIESLEELEDKEDFVETWKVIISGLAKTRATLIAQVGEIKTMKENQATEFVSAKSNIANMKANVMNGLNAEGAKVALAKRTADAAHDKCIDDEIKAKASRDQQIASLTTKVSALERQLAEGGLTDSQESAIRAKKTGFTAAKVALQLKNMDSKNECAREERALQRAKEAQTQHTAAVDQWMLETKEINAQMSAISNSTHVMTAQEPDFEKLTPVTVTSKNYKSLNKQANKFTAAAETSKKLAKQLESAGSDQMTDSRKPSLIMLLI